MKHSKTTASVQFDHDVIEFLQALQSDFDRSRSYLVNDIVRAYADVYRQQTPHAVPSRVIEV